MRFRRPTKLLVGQDSCRALTSLPAKIPGLDGASPHPVRLPLRHAAIQTVFQGILALAFFSVAAGQVPLAAGSADAPSEPVPPRGTDGDPSLQVERDWIDGRWNRTDVGQFLASNLEFSGNRVPKGLTIKVGEMNEGAVCFDTGSCAWRAAWTGGFLRFDPARFGLIHAPRIAGDMMITSPSGAGWAGMPTWYNGLHQHGKRVVLEYRVDNARVLDSPWLETRDELKVFIRSIELAPHPAELKLIVAAAGEGELPATAPSQGRAVINLGTKVLAVSVLGVQVSLANENGKLVLRFPAHDAPLRAKLLLWAGDKKLLPRFDEFAIAASKIENLTALLEPGPGRWWPELQTQGQRGLDTDFLAVDTLTVPYDNPWSALMFLAGVDFTPNGAAYVCSIHGDVWRVTGIDDSLRNLRWKRYATGLFQPLGLKVRDGEVFVLGRDQITRLHDLNADGEADFYENFSNLIDTAPGHNYVTCLENDVAGNFYYVDPRGVHRISPDGRSNTTLAAGFRNPNGLGVSPDGSIVTVAPQQGEWTPSSALCEVKLGGYYGYGGPRVTADRPLGYDAPLCWIPHSVDNSSGSQVWVPADRWGPLSGQMLHLLWGRCGLMLVLRDVVDGVAQGAVVPLPGRFLSGPNRGSFNPSDGHLYVAGSTGWQTSAVKDGALQRIRYTAKPARLPIRWHAQANGLALTFTEPLERSAAEDPGSYALHRWNYRYARSYGSKDWSVVDPQREGRDEVALTSARLLADGKSVFLEVPDLRSVMQMEVKYNLNAADGKPLRSQLWLTLNRLGTAAVH
ncbi:MAG: hypothetical protein HY735_04155 [Verrucomicrobia bacterium]|nr:hypothetical protein [Verrucomicrobiota bacterium]